MNSDNKKPKVCLMGASMGTSNLGVSALTASLVKILRYIHPELEIMLLIGNKNCESQEIQLSEGKIFVKVVNFRLSPKSRIREHLFWIFLLAIIQRIIPFKLVKNKIINSNPYLKAISQADYVGDIRGGDSFSDIYGVGRIIIGSIPSIITILLNQRIILLPQTYGPYNSRIGKCIARYIINKATYTISRDKQGIITIQHLLHDSSTLGKIMFCPDVAFMLDSIKPANINISPDLPIDTNSSLIIGFNINGLMYNGGYTKDNMFGLKMDYCKFANKLLNRLLESTSAHILFIPHTYSPYVESDTEASQRVFDKVSAVYKKRVHLLSGEYNQSEIKSIIGLCNFFIGSRMHACIGALSQGIPTIGIAYSKKFVGVFESVGAGDCVVDGRFLDTDEAVEQVLYCFQNRDDIKNNLQEKIENVKNEIIAAFRLLLDV